MSSDDPYIVLKDVSFTFRGWRESKMILRDTNLSFYASNFYAIIGSSGAGKTTLLNAIAGRLGGKGGELQGEVLFKPEVASRHVASYIIQEDVIPEAFSPKQILSYSAEFKLPRSVSRKEKKEKVKEILGELNLVKCQNNTAGSLENEHGISGGERKRTSIGIGIIHNPKIIYVDEPTSGLDSSAAYNVVKTLRSICYEDRCVICTIHQPSMEILALFTHIIVLSLGRTVFSGPLEAIVPYFLHVGVEFPPTVNIADGLMELVDTKTREDERYRISVRPSEDVTSFDASARQPSRGDSRLSLCITGSFGEDAVRVMEDEEAPADEESSPTIEEDPNTLPRVRDERRVEWLADRYAESALSIHELAKRDDYIQRMTVRRGGTVTKRNFLYVLLILLLRDSSAVRKNRRFIVTKVMQILVISVASSLLFYQLDHYQPSIRSRMGFVFFGLMANLLFGMIGVLFILPKEMPIFYRECLDGFYGVVPYFTAKSLIDVPIQLAGPIVFCFITHILVALPFDIVSFLLLLLCVVLMANVGASFGFVLSVIVKDFTSSLALMPAVFIPMVLFAGFVIDVDDLPDIISWVPYFDPVRYALSLGVYAVFMPNEEYFCMPNELINGICPLSNGDMVLRFFGYDDIPVVLYYLILFAFIFVLRTFAFYILTMKVESQKSR